MEHYFRSLFSFLPQRFVFQNGEIPPNPYVSAEENEPQPQVPESTPSVDQPLGLQGEGNEFASRQRATVERFDESLTVKQNETLARLGEDYQFRTETLPNGLAVLHQIGGTAVTQNSTYDFIVVVDREGNATSEPIFYEWGVERKYENIMQRLRQFQTGATATQIDMYTYVDRIIRMREGGTERGSTTQSVEQVRAKQLRFLTNLLTNEQQSRLNQLEGAERTRMSIDGLETDMDRMVEGIWRFQVINGYMVVITPTLRSGDPGLENIGPGGTMDVYDSNGNLISELMRYRDYVEKERILNEIRERGAQ